MQDYQPFLILCTEIAELCRIVVFYYLLIQQRALLFLRQKLTVKCTLDDAPHCPSALKLSLVDLHAVDHDQNLLSWVSYLGERTNGLIVCPVGEKDLGHPKTDLFLIVLQLYVLLKVLEAVLHQKVGFVGVA